MNKLTNRRDVPFEISFKYPLTKGFTFSELEKYDLNIFQKFLNKVSKMTVQQVDKTFARQPDKNDDYNGRQMLHYGISDSFRIHVILEEGRYVAIRLDPNHKTHN